MFGWTNTGSAMHTITFDTEPALSDPSLQPGVTWDVKFTSAGTYQTTSSLPRSGYIGECWRALCSSPAVSIFG
jgi:plastocyanin